jgi:NTP pyrophosphatase (non-canonical NTP hydrolase)
MEFKKYQAKTATTAIYPGRCTLQGVLYTALGLGEVGEIQGKVKKILRDSNGIISVDTVVAIKGEIGDCLWYLSQLCTELGLDLDTVAEENLKKLADRAARGVLKGSGDNR